MSSNITELMVIGSNFILAGATIVLSYVTFKDVNSEDQKTIRMALRRIPIFGSMAVKDVQDEQAQAEADADGFVKHLKWGEQA